MRARLVGVVALSVVFLAAPIARASRLSVKGSAPGGGTSVSNGSADVGTNDSSSGGTTSLWTDLGFTTAADFLVYGYKIANPDNFDTVVVNDLRAIATVPTPCPGCLLLGEVSDGSDLHNDPPSLDSEEVQNVAWYASLQPVPTTMHDGQIYQFALGPGPDADALDALILLVGGQNIHIGLSAKLTWPDDDPLDDTTPGLTEFVTPNDVAPEPASLILLGSGLVGLAARARRKRHNGPAAPDRIKLPQQYG